MKLYLARHGDYAMDIRRQLDVLTENGKRDIQALSDFISSQSLIVSDILHSSKHRAEETAALLSPGFQCEQAPRFHAGLDPNDDVGLLALEIASWHDNHLLVSHLPLLSKLTSLLVLGDENREIVNFKPGSLLCLQEVGKGKWMIHWMLIPGLY